MDPWRATLAVGLCVWVAGCKPTGGSPADPVGSGGAGGGAATATGGGTGLPFRELDAHVFDPGEGGVSTGRLRRSSKVDLLVVVDDSISMDDKHAILKEAVPDLLLRLVNPVCISTSGYTSQPATPADQCPPGLDREFKPVDDLHVGIITSSLGGVEGGGAYCGGPIGEPQNDGAHLLPTLPRGSQIPTYANRGFFKWDRAQTATPPGESDVNRLIRSFTDAVDVVGEVGCGFESTLEAWYRFLVDPEPPRSLTYGACDDAGARCLTRGPVDSVVLEQRRAFLRPDSLLLIVALTDEDDCSISPDHADFLVTRRTVSRPSSACATNPEDPCCYPCAAGAPAGCSADPSCDVNGGLLTTEEDPPNLTCFQPKRRFGIDPRFPTRRYVDALRSSKVKDLAGAEVDNPIFSGGRRPDEVFFVGVVGVPWQDLATDATLRDPSHLRLKSSRELSQLGVWDVILGNDERPGDPLMIPSIDPRVGQNPITLDALAPPTANTMANPINGHERIIRNRDDTQYSCIFPLAVPRDCSSASGFCDCKNPNDGANNPLCQDASGAYTYMQRYAKAYPPLRLLSFMRQLGESAVVASICPKNVDDKTREDYGYRAVIGAAIDDVAPSLIR